MTLAVGQTASTSLTITQAMIRGYAALTGDENPVHLDEAYAARTIFGRPIAHGTLISGLISKALGMQLPGPGTIYLRQTTNFRAPVFAGDTITATVTVTDLRTDKPLATLVTTCTNQDGDVVIDGEALVMYLAKIATSP